MAETGQPDAERHEHFLELIEEHALALREGRQEDADEASRQMLAYAAQQAETWHSPQADLLERAADAAARADWDGAERALLDAIAIAERPAMEYYARAKLVGHYALLGRSAAALEEARRARDAALREDLRMVHWMGLYDHADAALEAGAIAEARDSADAALAIVLGLEDEGGAAPHTRLRARMLRARVSIAEGNFDDARRELMAVPVPRLDHPRPAMPGICAAEARWWEASALILLHEGDTGGAVEARRHATERRRWVIESPQTDAPHTRQALARSLEALAEALHAAGHDAEAMASEAESHALLASLRLPPADGATPSQPGQRMIQ
jgi:hypothetical protein